jgi:hypothetical protein
LVRIGPVIRGDRNADARIGEELVAAGLIRFPDSLVDSRYEVDDVDRTCNRGLNDRELVAAQPGDDIGLAQAGTQASGHEFQQLVSDGVPERIVHRLELIEIEVKHRYAPAR